MKRTWGLVLTWRDLHRADPARRTRLIFLFGAVVSGASLILLTGGWWVALGWVWMGFMLGCLWSGLLGPAPRYGGDLLAPMLPVSRIDRALAASGPPVAGVGLLSGFGWFLGAEPAAALGGLVAAAAGACLQDVPTFGLQGRSEPMLSWQVSRPEAAVMLTAVERSARPVAVVMGAAVLVGLVTDGSRSGWFVIMSTLMTVVSCLPLFLVGEGQDAPLLPVNRSTVRGGVIAVATMWGLLTGLGDLLAGRIPGWRWLLGRLLFAAGGAALFVRLDGPLVWGGWMVVVAVVGGLGTAGQIDLLGTPSLLVGAALAGAAVWRAMKD